MIARRSSRRGLRVADVYRYRLGTFRLFYTIREREVLVVVIDR